MVAIGAMATAASTVVIRDMVKEVDGVTMVGEVVVILVDSTKTRHHQFKLRILTRTRWLAIRRGAISSSLTRRLVIRRVASRSLCPQVRGKWRKQRPCPTLRCVRRTCMALLLARQQVSEWQRRRCMPLLPIRQVALEWQHRIQPGLPWQRLPQPLRQHHRHPMFTSWSLPHQLTKCPVMCRNHRFKELQKARVNPIVIDATPKVIQFPNALPY